MKIGLDFDGVITNLGKLKALVAKKLFDKDIPERNFDKKYALENNIVTEEEYNLIKEFSYFEREALASTYPVEGAIENIHKLLDEGHDIKIVTAREGLALEHAKEWLLSHNLSLPAVGVGFGKSKREAVKGLDVFVDDFLIQLYYITDLVPHRFLFSWDYNEIYNERGCAIRVHTWPELYQYIQSVR